MPDRLLSQPQLNQQYDETICTVIGRISNDYWPGDIWLQMAGAWVSGFRRSENAGLDSGNDD